MKVGLQDAIAAIHGAKGADVENFIAAAGIGAGTGAAFNEHPVVSGKKEDLFALLYGVFRGIGNSIEYSLRVFHYLLRDVAETLANGFRHRLFVNAVMNIKF